MKKLIFILILLCSTFAQEEKESEKENSTFVYYSIKYQQSFVYFPRESRPPFYDYTRQFVGLHSFDLEFGKIYDDGLTIGGVFNFGKGNIGGGLHLGRQTLTENFRFNGGGDIGVWLFSAQAMDKNGERLYGRVSQTVAFGGPRIGFLLGFSPIFLDFNSKIYLGINKIRDMDRYNYDRGFIHNFNRDGETSFYPIVSANIGLTFISPSAKNRGGK